MMPSEAQGCAVKRAGMANQNQIRMKKGGHPMKKFLSVLLTLALLLSCAALPALADGDVVEVK